MVVTIGAPFSKNGQKSWDIRTHLTYPYGREVGGWWVGVWVCRCVCVWVGGGGLNLRTAFPKGALVAEKLFLFRFSPSERAIVLSQNEKGGVVNPHAAEALRPFVTPIARRTRALHTFAHKYTVHISHHSTNQHCEKTLYTRKISLYFDRSFTFIYDKTPRTRKHKVHRSPDLAQRAERPIPA